MPQRIDSTDGTAYPLESFLEVYGEEDGRRRWAIAEMWTWKLQNGGLKVTICLAGGGTVSDDEMVRRAAHLGDVMHYGMLLWDGNSPLNMTLDCANRGFGDKGMLALCDALVKIRLPGICSCLKLYSLRITDASMPHISNVLKVYEGGVSELHLSHNVGITNQGVRTLCNKDILKYYPLRNARSGLCKPLWLRLEQCNVNGKKLNLDDWMYTPVTKPLDWSHDCPPLQIPYVDLPLPRTDAFRTRPQTSRLPQTRVPDETFSSGGGRAESQIRRHNCAPLPPNPEEMLAQSTLALSLQEAWAGGGGWEGGRNRRTGHTEWKRETEEIPDPPVLPPLSSSTNLPWKWDDKYSRPHDPLLIHEDQLCASREGRAGTGDADLGPEVRIWDQLCAEEAADLGLVDRGLVDQLVGMGIHKSRAGQVLQEARNNMDVALLILFPEGADDVDHGGQQDKRTGRELEVTASHGGGGGHALRVDTRTLQQDGRAGGGSGESEDGLSLDSECKVCMSEAKVRLHIKELLRNG
jgi:hypothetical protein